jgi:hypothetical protein
MDIALALLAVVCSLMMLLTRLYSRFSGGVSRSTYATGSLTESPIWDRSLVQGCAVFHIYMYRYLYRVLWMEGVIRVVVRAEVSGEWSGKSGG